MSWLFWSGNIDRLFRDQITKDAFSYLTDSFLTIFWPTGDYFLHDLYATSHVKNTSLLFTSEVFFSDKYWLTLICSIQIVSLQIDLAEKNWSLLRYFWSTSQSDQLWFFLYKLCLPIGENGFGQFFKIFSKVFLIEMYWPTASSKASSSTAPDRRDPCVMGPVDGHLIALFGIKIMFFTVNTSRKEKT